MEKEEEWGGEEMDGRVKDVKVRRCGKSRRRGEKSEGTRKRRNMDWRVLKYRNIEYWYIQIFFLIAQISKEDT